MAQKKTKEQKIADLNESIRRTKTKITNARNAIQNCQAKKDTLQELHRRLETELETLEDQNGRQSENYEGLDGWRGNVYTEYQYHIAEVSAKTGNGCSTVEDRLDAIQNEIKRLEDTVYEHQISITKWTDAITSYERELFWA